MPRASAQYGIHDVAGNVWEWCADWYDDKYYQSAPASNPTGPAAGLVRVIRGGDWSYGIAEGMRTAIRYMSKPSTGNSHVGFRCVARALEP